MHPWNCTCDSCQEERESWVKKQEPMVIDLPPEDAEDSLDVPVSPPYDEIDREHYLEGAGDA